MDFSIKRGTGKIIEITIIGVVEKTDMPELAKAFQELRNKDFQEVVLDISFVPFVASGFVDQLVELNNNIIAKGQKMRIKGITDSLLDTFYMIGLDELFPIEK